MTRIYSGIRITLKGTISVDSRIVNSRREVEATMSRMARAAGPWRLQWIGPLRELVRVPARTDGRFVLAAGSEGPESEYLAPGVYEGPHGH